MTLITKALLIVASLVLAACNNPDRFQDRAGGAGAGGIDVNGLGDPNDPNSPAYFAQTLGDTVLFAVDQHVLSGEAQGILTQQAQWMIGHPQYTAIIEGHADEQGTREYNLALGARRAASVQQFLIARGVAPDRLRTVSYGKERPLAVCSEESCYERNRRSVTVLGTSGGV